MENIGIRVYANKDTTYALGSASITLAGQFAINNIRIVTGQYGLFLRMPSQQIGESEGGKQYMDVFYPADSETRKELTKQVISLYNQAKESESMMAETTVNVSELPFDVSIKPAEVEGPDKASVSLKFLDKFYVDNLKVRYKADQDQYYVAMPSYRTKAGDWKNIVCPVTAEFREMLSTGILEAYKKTVELSSAQI